jgi:calcium-dependent protein kinase
MLFLPATCRRVNSGLVGADRAQTLRRASSSCGLQTPKSLRVVTDTILEKRYMKTEDIAGSGISGAVRIVVDRATRQRRVLKTLRYAGKEEHDRDALLREMDVYLKLDHPNICRLLEVYAEESACHLVMELCTGRDLCERWETRGRYSEEETRDALTQMLSAVRYLHSNDIVHRDLKLENWVYADTSDDASLKLIDFGFSELVTPDTKMTAILGTIFYVAPEVLQCSYGLKCDLWSLGVIAHMLMTGLPPFGSFTDDDDAIFDKILSGDAAYMRTPEWRDISEEAKGFVRSLLTYDPVERPSVQEASDHPWVQNSSISQDLDVEVLRSLRSFASMNVLKRTACGLLAASTDCESSVLQAQFSRLDTRHQGAICMEELVDALKEHLGMCEEEGRELFTRLDTARNGRIDYSEFLAATVNARFMAQEQSIKDAFDRFDTDHSGFISRENLLEVLGNSYMGLRPEDIINQIQSDGVDVIRYEDFVKAMMDLGCSGEGSSLPGNDQRVTNISRAFAFTSQGALSLKGGPQRRPERRSSRRLGASRVGSLHSLQRGWQTPDPDDEPLERVDMDAEDLTVGFGVIRHKSVDAEHDAREMEMQRHWDPRSSCESTRSSSPRTPKVSAGVVTRSPTDPSPSNMPPTSQSLRPAKADSRKSQCSTSSSSDVPRSDSAESEVEAARCTQLIREEIHVSEKE